MIQHIGRHIFPYIFPQSLARKAEVVLGQGIHSKGGKPRVPIWGGVFLSVYNRLSYKKRSKWTSFAMPLKIAFAVIAVPLFGNLPNGENAEQGGMHGFGAETDFFGIGRAAIGTGYDRFFYGGGAR